MALSQFEMQPGEGLYTDMHAIRKDYFLDHDHSAFVDQWDWEKAIRQEDRNLEYLTDVVQRIWRILKHAEQPIRELFPSLRDSRYPELSEEITFIHAEELLERYPDLSRKDRESAALQEHPALFIYGIGWPLADGLPHELRAADYDDWASEVRASDGRLTHGLNGDILVMNPVTGRRHELSSMGIRVDAASLQRQLEMSGQLELLRHDYHQAILKGDLPQSIGGGIGQSRTYMLLLGKAHIGEVSVSVWPKILKEMCHRRNIHVLD
jgi:aspartate--ammonia ligase